ncbi:membrane permease [Salmonella enterica subsp. arizonae]|nr:membrane permease [Salmonella enterica subsp. arizonae]
MTATPSNKKRESAGLGIANILAGFYGGIAGCAMIGQTIVNVEMGKGRSRVSTLAAGVVLLLLVTALSEVMAKIPMAVLAGIMAIVAVKTFSWHSIQPATLTRLPIAETLVMAGYRGGNGLYGKSGDWRRRGRYRYAVASPHCQTEKRGDSRNPIARPGKISLALRH